MDPIGAVAGLIGQVLDALRNTQGGFGLLVLPLGLFWIVALVVSRHR